MVETIADYKHSMDKEVSFYSEIHGLVIDTTVEKFVRRIQMKGPINQNSRRPFFRLYTFLNPFPYKKSTAFLLLPPI